MSSVSDPSRSAWTALRPLLLRVHFYAGVLVAPFLVLTALTGLAYVVSPQLSDLIYAHELRVGPHTGPVRPLDEQVAAALDAHPEGTVAALLVPADPDHTTAVQLAVPGLPADTVRSVYVDPYTGQVRGALDARHDAPPLQATLHELHRSLLLGEVGRGYSELAASWLPVLTVGGVALWIGRRRTRLVRVPARGTPAGRARVRGWHGAVGVWLTVALLFISSTGLALSEHAGARRSALISALGGSPPQLAAEPVGVRSQPQIGVQAALDAARGAGLTGPVTIRPPTTSGAAFTVAENAGGWPVRRDAVAVDPGTGQVRQTVRWADWPALAKLTQIGVLAHTGALFGLVNQLALAAMALGLLAVIFWGYRMWWQRRPTRGGWPGPLAPRAATRLSPPVALIVLLLTVLVGWQVPLLGISLLGFVAVDALVAAVGRRRARRPGRVPAVDRVRQRD